MHLQLVVNNDIQKATVKPHLLPPVWGDSEADKSAARELIRAIEVRPGMTVAEALEEYVEARLVAEFAASDEGYAISDDELFEVQQRSIALDLEVSLLGLNFGWTRPLHGAPAITHCFVMSPRRLLKKEPKLKKYKHLLEWLEA